MAEDAQADAAQKVVPIDAARDPEAQTEASASQPAAPPPERRSWLLPGALLVVAAVLAFFLVETYNQRVALEAEVAALQGELTQVQGELEQAYGHVRAVGEQVTTLSRDLTARFAEFQAFVASGLPEVPAPGEAAAVGEAPTADPAQP